MNFLNLEYFIVTAEEMNFTRAARRLYISQPSLSNHIAKLEDELEVRLFDRNPPLTLTDAGMSLLKNARRMMSVKEDTEKELQDIRDFKKAELVVGVTRLRGSYSLPPLLTNFRKIYPDVRIRLVEGTTEYITDALQRGEVNLTIGHMQSDLIGIKSEVLFEESLLLIVSDSILKQYFTETERNVLLQYKKLPIKAFARCPFIKMKDPSWIGEIFLHSCREAGFTPNIILETDVISTMVSLCKVGYAVGLSPAIFVEKNSMGFDSLGGGEIRSFVLDFPGSQKTIAANYLENKYQTVLARQFIQMARETLGGR